MCDEDYILCDKHFRANEQCECKLVHHCFNGLLMDAKQSEHPKANWIFNKQLQWGCFSSSFNLFSDSLSFICTSATPDPKKRFSFCDYSASILGHGRGIVINSESFSFLSFSVFVLLHFKSSAGLQHAHSVGNLGLSAHHQHSGHSHLSGRSYESDDENMKIRKTRSIGQGLQPRTSIYSKGDIREQVRNDSFIVRWNRKPFHLCVLCVCLPIICYTVLSIGSSIESHRATETWWIFWVLVGTWHTTIDTQCLCGTTQ